MSGIHDPVISTSHAATDSSAHDAFLSGVHNAQLSGEHDPSVSGVHTAFLSGLHAPEISGAHDPISSGGHDAEISGLHDVVLSGGHSADLSTAHDPAVSATHNAVISDAHDPLASGLHTTALSDGHNPAISGLHEPIVSGDAHAAVVSGLHEPALSDDHSATDSSLHDAIVSSTHDTTISLAHEPTDSAGHNDTISQFHSAIASGAHDATISDGHNASLSALHTPALSGGHDPAISGSHDPISSTLGAGVDGTGQPPNIPFEDVFDFEGTTASQPFERQELSILFDAELGALTASAFSRPGFALHESGQMIFIAGLAQTATTETVIADSVALGLGMAVGARLVDLGNDAEVIVPVDFAFTSGWDSPPAGAIFDVPADLGGLVLADIGASLPASLSGWITDFFLPGSRTSVVAGLTPMTYTGDSGGDIAAFAAKLGSGLEAIWRFDAATQSWGNYSPAQPSFVNAFTSLSSGDAILVKATSGATVDQVDLLPRNGSTRSITLNAGSNFVSYSGNSGNIDALVAGVSGLESVFVLNASTQRWSAYLPGSPLFFNDLQNLDRLDAVFMRVTDDSTWSFQELSE